MAVRLTALAAFFCACAGLRVIPQTLLRSLPPARSDAVVCVEDWELDAAAASARGMTSAFTYGIGAWDNEEYLDSTKANPPPPPNDYEALRQAYAYHAMLVEKGWSEAGVSRGVVQEMIAELESGLDAATIAAVMADVAYAARPRPPPPPPTPPPTPTLQDPAATLALFGIPQGYVPPPVAPPTVSSVTGVTSSNSYATLMAATGGFPAATRAPPPPPPPPPPPVAAVRVAAVPVPVPVRVMLTVPPGVPPGGALAVTWEGTEYEVAVPEGLAAGESFEFELLLRPQPTLRATQVFESTRDGEDTRDSDSPARQAPPPPQLLPPPPPPPPPRGVVALPKKDPAVFRGQYKQYLQACLQQEGRKPESAILELMARLYAESPPTAAEATLQGEIVALEQRLGLRPAGKVGPEEMAIALAEYMAAHPKDL